MIAEHHRLALPAGYQLGKYRFREVLGAGGFGITYLAEDSSLGRRVAIKELLPNDIATRIDGTTVIAKTRSEESVLDWARERFVDEGRALAACDHPNVVNVYELIEANGTAYMVTKFEDGRSLAEWLKELERPPDETELRSILFPLLSGLEKVHAAGFLHRDIKPENIYLTTDGRPLLLDFGSARQSVNERTTALTVVVTAGYAPFEQYHEDGKQGAWSDIYALAAVVYRAITGKKPPEATRRLKDDPCVKLAQAHAGAYQPKFLNAIDNALAVEAPQRPQSVAAWRDMMGEGPGSPIAANIAPNLKQTDGTAASPSPLKAKVDLAVAKLEVVLRKFKESVSKIEQLPAPIRENPLPALGLAAAALLLGCWVGWKISRPRPIPHPPIAVITPPPKAPKAITTPTPPPHSTLPPVAVQTPPPAAPGTPPPTPRPPGPTPPVSTPPPSGPTRVAQGGPQPGQPWQDSLGIRFVPLPGSNAHMAVWKTRKGDFDAFVQSTGYNANGGMTSSMLKGSKAKGLTWQNPGFAQTPDHPVVGVSAYDALAFCDWLTQKELKEGVIREGYAYRLPTDQEWTAAAGHAAYPWGDSWPPPADSVGNFAGNEARTPLGRLGVIPHYSDGFVATSPGGSFPANANGLFDIGGNAAEWCGTWYRRDLNSDDVLRKVPKLQEDGDGKSQLTIRGSSCFTHNGELLRLDTRSNNVPTTRSDAIGFRVVLGEKNPEAIYELPKLLAPANNGKKGSNDSPDATPGEDSDNAAKVDPKIVGIWETKGTNENGPWTLRWDQQANGHFIHSKSDTDTGMVTAIDGKLRVFSDTSQEWTDETYEFSSTTTLVTEGADGKATWKRVGTHASSSRRHSYGDSGGSSGETHHSHHSAPNPINFIRHFLPF